MFILRAFFMFVFGIMVPCHNFLILCDRRELHKNESSRIMGENVELIKEINDLRRENRSLKSTQGRDEPGRGNSQELLRELVRLPS